MFALITARAWSRCFPGVVKGVIFGFSGGSKPRFLGICMVKIRKLASQGVSRPKNPSLPTPLDHCTFATIKCFDCDVECLLHVDVTFLFLLILPPSTVQQVRSSTRDVPNLLTNDSLFLTDESAV